MYSYFGIHSISVFVTCDRGIFIILGLNVDNNIQEYKAAYNSYLGGGGKGSVPLPIFFCLRIYIYIFLVTELKRGHIKELG
jgi:hypothetical protein